MCCKWQIRRVVCILLVAIFIFNGGQEIVRADIVDKQLNIYALYLEGEEKGDSVLLESRGEYLLMDIGMPSKAISVIDQLEELDVQEVSIYFSHLHKDHIGSSEEDLLDGLRQIRDAEITISKLYLPSPDLVSLSVGYPTKYQQFTEFMNGMGEVIYLKPGDKIQVGDAQGEIIGPLESSKITPDKYIAKQEATGNANVKYTYYENNCSLISIFTCGSTRFFSGGDCLKDEANLLVQKYGSDLKCDIMKFNHHGTGTGNSKKLLDAIQPRFSFGLNTGLDGKDDTTQKWQFSAAYEYASKYGFCYFTGNEKKTLIFEIKDDVIKLYQGSRIRKKAMMKGWQLIYGADGILREKDAYYFNGEGVIETGLREIDGRLYDIKESGQLIYADYDANGDYLYWKKDKTGKRYYQLSEDGQLAYLLRGFEEVNHKLYYFNEEGYRLEGVEDPTHFTKIGNQKYLIGKNGVIYVDDFVEIGESMYYVNEKGVLQKNKKMEIMGEWFLIQSNGQIIFAESAYKELVEYEGDTYLVYDDGHVAAGVRASYEGDIYYFDPQGIMQTQSLQKFKGKYYFFDKMGRMVTNSKVRVKGKPRYFGSDGSMYRRCYIEYKGKVYECDNEGVMKWVKYPAKHQYKYNSIAIIVV